MEHFHNTCIYHFKHLLKISKKTMNKFQVQELLYYSYQNAVSFLFE